MQTTTSASERAARLKALLEEDAGLDLDAALDRLASESRPGGVQTTLARAALMRSFDRAAYGALVAGEGAPSLEVFGALPEVEPVPGQAGSFWVAPDARARSLAPWRSDPAGALALHRAAADFYALSEPADPLARLHHLAASDPEAARALFERELDAADERFDLARCNALIDVLRGAQARLALTGASGLDPALAQALADRQRRFVGRSLFADAYYRTGKYLSRPALHAAFDAVRGDTGPWILNLHATGGMGKTIFLRWLVARDLVPSGVPCARLDFDELSLDALRQRPWLALLPLCEQLNPQLPRPFLTEILESAPAFRPLIDPQRSAARSAVPEDLAAPHDADGGAALARRIGYGLLESGAERLVVVLDTLEVTTVFPETFAAIFELMRGLHEQVRGLRLVLAGRYDIATKVPALAPALAAEALTYPIDRFDDTEATAYLALRGIAEDPELVAAIVAKVRELAPPDRAAGCNPFKLALLADLVLARDGADIDFVRSLPSADYQYLLERVIKRIPEQSLRWVVRYGVIPRRLDFEYMQRVLIPPLERVLGGTAPEDSPRDRARLPEGLQGLAEQDIWVPEPAADLSPERLWDALLRYESDKGWISLVPGAGARGGSLQLHSDVAGPMRDLLSYQPVFDVLQESSVAYFDALAGERVGVYDATAADNPERVDCALAWASMVCESIFHLVQREPRGGIAAWERAVASPLAAEHPEVRLKLALELLRPDYAEDGRIPRTRRGLRLVEEHDLAEAHLCAAESIETLLRTGRPSPDASWTAARRHVEDARELAGSAGASAELAARLDLLAAVLAAKEKDPRAVEMLRAVLGSERHRGRGLVASWHLAETLASASDPKSASEAAEQYERTITIATGGTAQLHGPAGERTDVVEDSTDLLGMAAPRGDGGIYELLADSSMDPPGMAAPQGAIRQLRRENAQLLVRDGRPLHARAVLLDALADARDGPPGDRVPVLLDLAELDLSIGEYGSALAVLRDTERALEGAEPAERVRALCLAAALWSGLACAPEDLDEALRRAERSAPTPIAGARALHAQALLAAASRRIAAASELWDRALRIAEREGDLRVQTELVLHRARTAGRAGRYREVLVLAEGALRVAEGGGDFRAVAKLELERALALARGGEDGAARAALHRALGPDNRGAPLPPRIRAQALALGIALALLTPEDRSGLPELAGLVAKAYPGERHLYLEPLRHAPGPIPIAAGLLDSLDAALAETGQVRPPEGLGGAGETPDPGTLRRGLVRVDLHRVFGDPRRALALLDALPVELPKTTGRPLDCSLVPRRLLVAEARRRIGLFETLPPLPGGLDREPAKSLVSAALQLEQAEAMLALDKSRKRIAELLELAAPGLGTEQVPTRWSAKHLALQGRLALRAGQVGDAKRSVDTAAALLDELGDAVGRRLTTGIVSAAAPEGVGDFYFAVDSGAGAMPPVGPGQVVLMPRWPDQAADAVADSSRWLARFEPPKGRAVSESLAEDLAKDWRALADRLAPFLLSDEALKSISEAQSPLALRVKLPADFLGALPWETMRIPGEEAAGAGSGSRVRALSRGGEERPGEDQASVRFVQWALSRTGPRKVPVDGLLGPLTRNAIEGFQQASGLAPSGRIDPALIEALARRLRPEGGGGRVLTVQPEQTRWADEDGDYASRGGGSIEQVYADAGAEVLPLYRAGAKEIAESMARFDPTLIHLVATVRDSGGMVFLDFSRRRGNVAGDQLTAPSLDSLLKGRRAAGPSPFLVLDIARPSSTFEAALALGQRNLFAAELLRLRTFSGVLASGLEQPAMLGTLARTVAGALAEGATMGGLGMAVRALFAREPGEGSELDRVLAYLGTALFAESPDLPCSVG